VERGRFDKLRSTIGLVKAIPGFQMVLQDKLEENLEPTRLRVAGPLQRLTAMAGEASRWRSTSW